VRIAIGAALFQVFAVYLRLLNAEPKKIKQKQKVIDDGCFLIKRRFIKKLR
jgi:hypothetical protein